MHTDEPIGLGSSPMDEPIYSAGLVAAIMAMFMEIHANRQNDMDIRFKTGLRKALLAAQKLYDSGDESGLYRDHDIWTTFLE